MARSLKRRFWGVVWAVAETTPIRLGRFARPVFELAHGLDEGRLVRDDR